MIKYNQELIDWFKNYFDNCYYVKHDEYPESIFMFYDINYVRQKKLAKLEGKNIEKTDITGVCLFEQEWKYNWFGCNYNLIWCYLRDNYSFNHVDFQEFIKYMLEEHTKMSVLTPSKTRRLNWSRLEEHTKMSVLTPHVHQASFYQLLEEHTKMSVLTPPLPTAIEAIDDFRLEEHTKMSVLTPRWLHFSKLNFVGRTYKNECTNTNIDQFQI